MSKKRDNRHIKLGELKESDFETIVVAISLGLSTMLEEGDKKHAMELVDALEHWKSRLDSSAAACVTKAALGAIALSTGRQMFGHPGNSDNKQDDEENHQIVKVDVNLGFSVPADATDGDIREAADGVRDQVIKDITNAVRKAKRNED